MKSYKQQIKEYKEEIEEKYVRAGRRRTNSKSMSEYFVRVGLSKHLA